jgi:hypothetical protein
MAASLLVDRMFLLEETDAAVEDADDNCGCHPCLPMVVVVVLAGVLSAAAAPAVIDIFTFPICPQPATAWLAGSLQTTGRQQSKANQMLLKLSNNQPCCWGCGVVTIHLPSRVWHQCPKTIVVQEAQFAY